MKTKFILFLCLFMSVGFMKISAQNGKNGTGTEVYTFQADWSVTYPIECDGEIVDEVIFNINIIKCIDHFKNGQLIWGNYSVPQTDKMTSLWSGEEFVIRGDLERFRPREGRDYWKVNLIGNMGNHYIVHFVYNLDPFEIIEIHGVCN